MAIGEYLKQAAAQLRRAAVAQKTETSELRRTITNREQEVVKMVNDTKRNMQAKEVLFKNVESDSERAHLLQEIKNHQEEIRNLQINFEQEKQRINDSIKAMEQQQVDLNAQASNFERQASAG